MDGVSFEAGGKSYEIRFTQNALYRLEKELGRSLLGPAMDWGVVHIQTMLWAGLEGARLKAIAQRVVKARTAPFTIDETGELMDAMAAEGLKALDLVMEAWNAAHPKTPEPEEGGGGAPANPSHTSRKKSDGKS